MVRWNIFRWEKIEKDDVSVEVMKARKVMTEAKEESEDRVRGSDNAGEKG